MWLLIREASMARNLRALLPLVEEYGPWHIAFCTDDRDPDDIADSGHINGMVRERSRPGIAPEDACSWPRTTRRVWHGLSRHGAIAPGYVADLLVLPTS
jgi:adenine deaminase